MCVLEFLIYFSGDGGTTLQCAPDFFDLADAWPSEMLSGTVQSRSHASSMERNNAR